MNKQQLIKSRILTKLDERQKNIQKQWAQPMRTKTRHFFIDDLLPTEIAYEIFNAFRDQEKNLKRSLSLII